MFTDFFKKFGLEKSLFEQLTPAETEMLSDKMSKKIIDLNIKVPAEFFLEVIRPMTVVGGISLWMGAPFLEIFGIKGYSYSKFFMKRENIRNLIKKIKERS